MGHGMVFLGFGKYVRADRIYALEPITGEDRGSGSRTLVWVDGIPEPVVASRTQETILAEIEVSADSAAGVSGPVANSSSVASSCPLANASSHDAIKVVNRAPVDSEMHVNGSRTVVPVASSSPPPR